MHKQEIETKLIGYFYNGITDKLPYDISNVADYKHGFVRDRKLSWDREEVFVQSRDQVKILRSWGVTKAIEAQMLNILWKRGEVSLQTRPEPVRQRRYSCDSRLILKPLRDIIKVLKAQDRIAPKRTYQPISKNQVSPHNALMLCYWNDTQRAIEYINKNYNAEDVIDILNHQRFKHIYKICHQDTTFYEENGNVR